MKIDNGLATAFFAVVIGGAVVLAIANDVASPACKAASGSIAGKEFDFGCLEFWLYRYQSLIGSVVTAGVAGATLLWVARQLEAANRQAAASAAHALRAMAVDADQEISWAKTAEVELILPLERKVDGAWGKRYRGDLSLAGVTFTDQIDTFAEATLQRRPYSAAEKDIRECSERIIDLKLCFSRAMPVGGEFQGQLEVSSSFDFDQDERNEASRRIDELIPEVDTAENELAHSITALAMAWRHYRAALDVRKEAVWRTIRQLENSAVGDRR